MNNKVQCNCCLGQGVYMISKSSGRGFEYKDCTLCNGSGRISKELYDDYILSLDEESYFEDE